MERLRITSCVLLIVLVHQSLGDSSFRRNGEAFSMNWVFSLPWDVSNTLRAPLGGPLSLILTGGLSIILFFGLAVSPVFYLFGTPVRRYHLHDSIIDRLIKADFKEDKRLFPKNATVEKTGERGTFNDTKGSSVSEDSERISYPTFLDSFFWLIGEDDETCQKLMTCHAHGFFNFIPKSFMKYYRIFSRKMIDVPADFQEAIQLGLEDQSLCKSTYKGCSNSLVDISKKTFNNIMPTDLSGFSKWLSSVKAWAED